MSSLDQSRSSFLGSPRPSSASLLGASSPSYLTDGGGSPSLSSPSSPPAPSPAPSHPHTPHPHATSSSQLPLPQHSHSHLPTSASCQPVGLHPNSLTPGVNSAVCGSSPNSPMVRPAKSGGRAAVQGMKKFLRFPNTSTQSAAASSNPSIQELPSVASQDGDNKALFSRMLHRVQPMKIRHFRRKRRSEKTYHSDDGYTSDPGLTVREDDDDETDGDPDSGEVRKTQQIRDIEAKLERSRRQLQEEEDNIQDCQNEYLQGMESTMNDKMQQKIKSKFQSRNSKSRSNAETIKKKVEKYEEQLRQLKDGTLPPNSTYSQKMKEKFQGIKGSLTSYASNRLKKKQRYTTGSPQEDEDPGEGDDDIFPEEEDITHHSPSLRQRGASSDSHVESASTLKDIPSVGAEPSSRYTTAQVQQLLEAAEKSQADLQQLKAEMTYVFGKLEQEMEKVERLESQVNDITELHQHEVGELRAQLEQVDNLALTKIQDMEDAVEECQSKVEHLNVKVHRIIDTDDNIPKVSMARKPLANILSFLLIILSLVLSATQKTTAVLRSRLGLIAAAVVVLLAFLCICVWRY